MDVTRRNFINDITVPFGDITSGAFVDLFDFGDKYLYRGIMITSTLDKPVTLRFDNPGVNSDFPAWDSSVIYKRGIYVKASTGDAYQSLQSVNLNKNPVSEPTWWAPFSQELTIPAAWEVAPDKFGYNGVLLIKHDGSPPTTGFLKIVSWRAE
jgi:hypothetical protein